MSRTTLHRIAAGLAAVLIAFCAWAQDSPRIDELMRKSGLWEQVASTRAQLRSGAQQAREDEKARGSKSGSDADFERLLAAIDSAFEPERMRRVVGREMSKRLDAADVDEVLAWLSSDLGRRFTRLEEEASARDSSTLERDAGKILAGAAKPRVALLERLVAALDMDARSADNLANMTSAIVYGLAAASPQADPDEAVAALRKKLDAQRAPLMAYFHRISLASLVQAYRGVSDGDLERYVRFNETPAARRYNDAASHALETAVVQGSLEIGRRLGRDVQRPSQRS